MTSLVPGTIGPGPLDEALLDEEEEPGLPLELELCDALDAEGEPELTLDELAVSPPAPPLPPPLELVELELLGPTELEAPPSEVVAWFDDPHAARRAVPKAVRKRKEREGIL